MSNLPPDFTPATLTRNETLPAGMLLVAGAATSGPGSTIHRLDTESHRKLGESWTLTSGRPRYFGPFALPTDWEVVGQTWTVHAKAAQ